MVDKVGSTTIIRFVLPPVYEIVAWFQNQFFDQS